MNCQSRFDAGYRMLVAGVRKAPKSFMLMIVPRDKQKLHQTSRNLWEYMYLIVRSRAEAESWYRSKVSGPALPSQNRDAKI